MEELTNNIEMEEALEAVEFEESGNGIVPILVIGGVALAGGLVALGWKFRHKFTEMNIKRLEKKGYSVTKLEEVEEIEEDSEQ